MWVSVDEEKSKSSDSGGLSLSHLAVQIFSSSLKCLVLSSTGDASEAKCSVSLMPYTLVTPNFPPVCRPVLLLPTVLGRMLDKKLAGWQGFQLCEPGENPLSVSFAVFLFVCSSSSSRMFPLQETHAAKNSLC